MLATYARVWRAAAPLALPLAPVPSRGKKKKAGRRTSSPTEVSPEVAAMVDLSRFESGMQKAVEALQSNYSKIRVGGAAPGMLDGIKVEAYGASTPLSNLAQVSTRDGKTLVVSVFDEATSSAVERAIRGAGLNLNPVPEGPAKLRVPVPKQTEKARDAFAKVALRDAEAAKIATRMVRRKAMDAVKTLKDEVGKDDLQRMENNVQQMSEKYIDAIATSLDEKINSLKLA